MDGAEPIVVGACFVTMELLRLRGRASDPSSVAGLFLRKEKKLNAVCGRFRRRKKKRVARLVDPFILAALEKPGLGCCKGCTTRRCSIVDPVVP